MRVNRWCGGISLVAAVVLVVGCGPSEPKRYGVSGTVKYKGKPIKTGTINFRADDGASGGGPIVDGKYDIPAAGGLTPGNYRVAISYPDPKVKNPVPDDMPGDVVTAKEMLPSEYNEKTKLTAEVKPQSTNEVNFDLK
jgi:hypothetical protein